MPDLDAPIQAMVDATNREDTPAFLAAFDDGAVLIDWDREFVGKAEIARWNSHENIGMNSRIEVTGVEHEGDQTTIGVRVSGNGYNGGGSFVLQTRDGLIHCMVITG